MGLTTDEDSEVRRLLQNAAASLPVGPPPPLDRSVVAPTADTRRRRRLLLAAAVPAVIAIAVWETRGPAHHGSLVTATPATTASTAVQAPTLRDCINHQRSQIDGHIVDETLRLVQALGHNLDGPCANDPGTTPGVCGFAWSDAGWTISSDDPNRAAEVADQLRAAGIAVAGTQPCTPATPLAGTPTST